MSFGDFLYYFGVFHFLLYCSFCSVSLFFLVLEQISKKLNLTRLFFRFVWEREKEKASKKKGDTA